MVKTFICKFTGILIRLEPTIWLYRNWSLDKTSSIPINYNWGHWPGFLLEEFRFDVAGLLAPTHRATVGILLHQVLKHLQISTENSSFIQIQINHASTTTSVERESTHPDVFPALVRILLVLYFVHFLQKFGRQTALQFRVQLHLRMNQCK